MRRKHLLLVAAVAACIAVPVSAQAGLAPYGGIGARAHNFYAQNAHASGRPPIGVAYYRVDAQLAGRVVDYHIVLNRASNLSDGQLRRLVTRRQLPADVKQVQGWKPATVDLGVYCAIYKSRWLGRTLHGPLSTRYPFRYVVEYEWRAEQTAVVNVSTAAACRG